MSHYHVAFGITSGNLPEPSGTAGFYSPTYGTTYGALLRTPFCNLRGALTRLTYGNLGARRNSSLSGLWLQMACKLPGTFRKACGSLPGLPLTNCIKPKSPHTVPPIRLKCSTYGQAHNTSTANQTIDKLPVALPETFRNLPNCREMNTHDTSFRKVFR